MMIRPRILVVLLLLSTALASFVLRVRTVDGQMYRLEVDEEIKTIKQCRRKLIEAGKISELAKLKIKNVEFDETSEASLASLSLVNGEVVTVVDISSSSSSKTSQKQSTTNSSTTATQQTSNQHSKKKPISTKTSTTMKKKVVSIASMTAQKQSLEKITRQKSSSVAQSVIVMPSTERIFNRIASGGVALLLGRTLQYNPTFKTKKSTTSASSTTTTSSSDPTIERNLTVIYAAYELVSLADNDHNTGDKDGKSVAERTVSFSTAISQCKDRVAEVRVIAASMGLQIVGCGIGYPYAESSSRDGGGNKKKLLKTAKKGDKSDDNNDDDEDGWNADHIHSCVQLRELLDSHLSSLDQELFVTLR